MDFTTQKEYKKRMAQVLDHILKNLNKEISLHELAQIANYSPFHFQKLFKQMMGESPKQYVLKLRIETALHLLIIHQSKTISEVSADCGFSSPAVFSRAIKNFYGISPDKFRSLKLEERSAYLKAKNQQAKKGAILPIKEESFPIEIKKMQAIRGIYSIAPYDEPSKIKEIFDELQKAAKNNEIALDESKMMGIISPHQGNIYKCFLPLKDHFQISKKFNVIEIKQGIYASFKVVGNNEQTLKAAQYFYQQWLPKSGYRIADIIGFEIFCEDLSSKEYEQVERELFVPLALD